MEYRNVRESFPGIGCAWTNADGKATAYVDGKTGTVLEIRTFTRGYDEEIIVRTLLP